MIVQEIIEGNTTLVKTYSDAGLMIRKKGTDEIYSEAIDPQIFNREYEETDIPIENDVNDVDAIDDEFENQFDNVLDDRLAYKAIDQEI